MTARREPKALLAEVPKALPAARAPMPEWHVVLILLLAGLAVRLYCLQIQGGIALFWEVGESTRIALSLARHGTYADAFFPGEGPTAHMLPTMPLIAGGVFTLFGAKTAAANLVLLAWSAAQTFGGYLLLHRLFAALGTGRAARLIAIATLCLAPVFAKQDMIDFRYWEGALALCLATLNMLLILRLDRQETIGLRGLMAAALLSAAAFFVNPPGGLGIDACWAIFAWRRLPLRRAAQLALLSAAALGLLVIPWTVRNMSQLGSPVMLRDNFGLELAIGNYPAALDDPSPADGFNARLEQLHPYHGASGKAALRAAGGEIAYARALGRQAEDWIARNPLDFTRLAVRHYSEFFFPRPWQICYPGCDREAMQRSIVMSSVDLLGLATLVVGLWRRRRGFWMLALYVGLASLPYALVQPIPRYTYLVYGLMVFLAADGVVASVRWMVMRPLRPGVRRAAGLPAR